MNRNPLGAFPTHSAIGVDADTNENVRVISDVCGGNRKFREGPSVRLRVHQEIGSTVPLEMGDTLGSIYIDMHPANGA